MARKCQNCGWSPNPLVPSSSVFADVQQLVHRYGTIKDAGRAYDERFGKTCAGEMLMSRILHGQTSVNSTTADRLETLAAS